MIVLPAALVLLGLWLLLADNASAAEWTAGAISALAAAGLAVLVGRAAGVRGRIRAQGLARLVLVPWWIAQDGVRVCAAILTHGRPAGAFRTLPVDLSGTDAESTGRRALAAWAGSVGPALYVLDADADATSLTVHELAAPGGPSPPEVLARDR